MEEAKLKRYLLLVVPLLLIIIYFAYQEYEKFQGCGEKLCPDEINAKLAKKYSNLSDCPNNLCPSDLEADWRDAECSIDLANSLVFKVHITNDIDDSLADYDCEFGPMYDAVKSERPNIFIRECNRETAELIDDVVKGRKNSSDSLLRLMYVYPPHFNNYYYTVLACHKYTSGRLAGRYLLFSLINFSGYTY